MSRRKPLAAVAAVAATLALAAPAAQATPSIGAGPLLGPGSLPCEFLVSQITLATASGNTFWADAVARVFIYSGCGGAAI